MDFEFSPEQRAFATEVEQFLDEHDDPDVFDLTRENMAQIVDTPKRRAFMRRARRAGLARPHLAEGVRRLRGRGRLRVPPQRGARGARRPADRQGRRHHRQDAHQGGERLPEAGVPAEDPAQRRGVRGRLQRAQRRLRRGVDAAQGRARRARRQAGLDPQRPEDVDHVRALRRVVLARHAHRSRQQAPGHHAHARARSTSPASPSRASGRWATSAPTRSSSKTCSCPTSTSSAR